MSYRRESSHGRDRIALLRERVAALKEENATMKQTERNLEDAKEQVQIFNNHFILSN